LIAVKRRREKAKGHICMGCCSEGGTVETARNVVKGKKKEKK
jgi:hypothetical protein